MSKAQTLYDSFKKLYELQAKMGRTTLELIAHPDATPEQIQEASVGYRNVTQSLRKHKPVVVQALVKLGRPMLADTVQRNFKF